MSKENGFAVGRARPVETPDQPNLTGSPPIKNTSGRRAQSVGQLPFSRCQRTEVSVKRVPGIVLIASAVAFLALVFGLLVGAVIVTVDRLVARIASPPARRARCGGHRGPTPPQRIQARRTSHVRPTT